LGELQPGDAVRVQANNEKDNGLLQLAIKRVTPRSYLVKGNGRVLRRNRKFLRLTKERYISDFDGFDSIIGRN